jgi:hypothetical protein
LLTVFPAVSPTAETGRPQLLSIPVPNRALQSAPVRSDSSYGRLPLAFEPNVGQTAPEVRFLARGGRMTTFFTDAETVIVLSRSERRERDRRESSRRWCG